MAIIELNKDPSPSIMRWFGALLGLFFAFVGAVLLWRTGWGTATKVVFGLAVVLPLLYYAVPPLRRPMYMVWIHAAWPIGLAISFLLLAVIWYLVITPMGILRRTLGGDPMNRGFDRNAKTYWTPHSGRRDPARYFKPY